MGRIESVISDVHVSLCSEVQTCTCKLFHVKVNLLDMITAHFHGPMHIPKVNDTVCLLLILAHTDWYFEKQYFQAPKTLRKAILYNLNISDKYSEAKQCY